ncbi:MAG TPA: hypothetical protein VM241_07905 [Candidatus Thermoplasmatota archaeon]|nr:hypothetical protein [Candidatus Thermoplasmatota archaeon]
MRVPFGKVFTMNPDGSITPKVPIRIGGVHREPGSEFGARVRLGTIVDFASLRGQDLEVAVEGQGYVLVHPYRSARGIVFLSDA